jgi:membrane protein DedA with SNARE-associated domain
MVLASVVSDFTSWLDDVASNWWFLLVIFAVALLDSVLPIVPSETTVIIGGVAAGLSPWLALVILAGAAGAFAGDNLAYSIGSRFSSRVEGHAAARPKFAGRLRWARLQIRARGGPLLITARFIPGGRTALTLTSGITRQPRRWFAGWIAVAAVIWASYAALLGAVAGDRFQDNHTAAFAVAFGAAIGITLLIELVRHARGRLTTAEATGVVLSEVIEPQPDAAQDEDDDEDALAE